MSYEAAWEAIYEVVSALYEYRNYFVRWPTAAEAEAISLRIENRSRIPGIMGAVDGTHIRIRAPRIGRASYYNRNKYASIQLQVINIFSLKILNQAEKIY